MKTQRDVEKELNKCCDKIRWLNASEPELRFYLSEIDSDLVNQPIHMSAVIMSQKEDSKLYLKSGTVRFGSIDDNIEEEDVFQDFQNAIDESAYSDVSEKAKVRGDYVLHAVFGQGMGFSGETVDIDMEEFCEWVGSVHEELSRSLD